MNNVEQFFENLAHTAPKMHNLSAGLASPFWEELYQAFKARMISEISKEAEIGLLINVIRENEYLRKHPLKMMCDKCGVLTDVVKNKESGNE